MRKKSVQVLVLLTFVGMLAAVALAAVTEAPTPQVQTAPPLQGVPVQPGKPAWLTPDKEVALVEVRKILREARRVAEGIELPSRLLTDRHKFKAMEQIKARLLKDIGTAQLRAGDFPDSVGPAQRVYRIYALANYGRSQEAAQAAGQENLADDDLLVLVDLLSKAGNFSAALQAVEASTAREPLQWWRDRKRAVGFALLAQRQREQGDLGAEETLQRAIKAAQAIKVPEDRYRAFLHVGRTQAALGNQAGSAESFREAKQVAMGVREGGPVGALMWIAKTQAEAGDRVGSEQTFQEVLRLPYKSELGTRARFMGCLAWVQHASGNHRLARETVRLALQEVESSSPEERDRVLSEVGEWQLAMGDREAVVETITQILTNASSLSSDAAREGAEGWAHGLAREAREFQVVRELLNKMRDDDWRKAVAVAHLARALVKTRDPFGTPEVFKELARIATELKDKHLPKDDSERGHVLSSIAIVQATAGEIHTALQTADSIDSLDIRVRLTYWEIIGLLMERGDITRATQVAGSIRDEWFPLWGSAWVLRDFAKSLAAVGERTSLSSLTRQSNPWAKAYTLLGMSQGLMDQHGIPVIEGLKPPVSVFERCP